MAQAAGPHAFFSPFFWLLFGAGIGVIFRRPFWGAAWGFAIPFILVGLWFLGLAIGIFQFAG